MGETFLLYSALAVSAGSAVMSYESQQDAADAAEQQATAQKESLRAQQKMADVEAQRQRIQQVRESRIRRAQILASSGNTGLGVGTSGVSGSVSSVGSQAASNIGMINQTQTFAAEASAANQRAADAASRGARAQATAAQWQSIGGFSQSIFKDLGGWNKVFGTTKIPAVSESAPGK